VSALSPARVAAWLLAPAAFGCAAPPTERECVALCDHYAELLAGVNLPGATAADVDRIKARARAEARRRDPDLGDCRRRISRRALECALGAPSVDAVERCLL
jgi:hypothetical protein